MQGIATAVIPLHPVRVPSQLPEMLGGHPKVVKMKLKVPLPCPLQALPLILKVKGDVWYPGGAEGFVAVPEAVIEMDAPSIVTGALE